jgi:hypothetical protein
MTGGALTLAMASVLGLPVGVGAFTFDGVRDYDPNRDATRQEMRSFVCGQCHVELVERWFAALTQKQIKRGAHASTRALESAIRQYIAVTNEAPKPFVWTKTADEILASVARFCRRISETGH